MSDKLEALHPVLIEMVNNGVSEVKEMCAMLEDMGHVLSFKDVRTELTKLVKKQKISRSRRPSKGRFASFAWTYHPFNPNARPLTVDEMLAAIRTQKTVSSGGANAE